MKLNKKVEIAINAVSSLKGKYEPTRTSDLAKSVGTTVNFLEQIMRGLRIAGIVEVKRGPGGGYLPGLKTVTALEVAQAVGCDFENVILGTPADMLRANIVQAFLDTAV